MGGDSGDKVGDDVGLFKYNKFVIYLQINIYRF